MFNDFDRLAMTRALALAERGLETTHPNPRVGCVIAKGERIIAEGWHERAGITVEAGLLEAEATELNIGFMKRMKHGLPWVRVKLAMSLDGRTALANGASQWITGEPARNDVQRWRARCSAVMTGVGTVLADDPQLNVRTAGFKGRQPLRVILDARLRSPPGAKMFVGLGAAVAVGRAAGVPAAAAGAGGATVGARVT